MPPPPASPSQAFREWDTTRRGKLDKLDARCVWAAGLVPADPGMEGEHLRAYAVLLSAHFQGFCRDLYSEASQTVVSRVKRVGLRSIIKAQFVTEIKLNRSNPTLDVLTDDFRRLGILNLRTALGTSPPVEGYKGGLRAMNDCRNKCAHGAPDVPELRLANIRDWRNSCDWFATRLNEIVYHTLRKAFRANPW